ncbi:MAG: HAMP domain-containing protein [Williamsia sp.]|nr:HAMP domain-containing protein [Williamsia sp.]
MYTSVKSQVRSGTIFLFILVILSGGFSIFYLQKLYIQTQHVSKANYQSLEYCHRMQAALDGTEQQGKANRDTLSKYLRLQRANITEKGEREATARVEQWFAKLKGGESSAVQNIRQELQTILSVNMQAIRIKNEQSESSAQEAKAFLIAIVGSILLIGFSFVISFPSVITAPIEKLTEAIKKVGEKDYTHRIHIQSKDEFGKLAGAFNEMAERLEYFENSNLNKIIFEKSRAEAVINSLQDASIGIDKTGTVLFANNKALQLLGLQVKDIVGSKAAAVSAQNDLFRFLLEEKGTVPFKVVVDNRENYFIKEVVDIDQEGSKSRVIVLKNITSFKELDVAKTNFIATVSHELKTPLASSDLGLTLLEDERIGKLTEEQRDLIQNLKQDNQRMLRILSELLNMSQVEAGKIQLDIAEVSPYAIADNAIEAVQTAAKEKNIRIQKLVAEHLPAVKADWEKTGWVLTNLLTNAIKHSPKDNTINLEIKEGDGHVAFSVSDQGPGIPPEFLPKVFDRFFKVPGSKVGGTGLGLAISKEFIEGEGGRIWVQSEIGSGSVFGFYLLKC